LVHGGGNTTRSTTRDATGVGVLSPIIHLPQLNSPRRGPSKKAAGIPPDFDMVASEGGYPLPVTSKRLPACGRAPDCVEELIANGQQSTDSSGAASSIFERSASGVSSFLTKGSHRNNQRYRHGETSTKGLPRRDSVSGSIGRRGSVDRFCGRGRVRNRVGLSRCVRPVAGLLQHSRPNIRPLSFSAPPSASRPKVNSPGSLSDHDSKANRNSGHRQGLRQRQEMVKVEPHYSSNFGRV
jgi:hypothetical protein